MTGLHKLEQDRTRAELASVEAILDRLTDGDVMTRLSLEERRDELRAAIESFDQREETAASAVLFFGGRPVAGARGVESEFAGNAIAKFQDLVAKLVARQSGELGQRGVVPKNAAAALHITTVVRGSFGFLLEGIDPQLELAVGPLKAAVANALEVLRAFSEPSEEKFQEAVEAVDNRIVTTAGELFSMLRDSGATMRLVVGNSENSFGSGAVMLAAERANTTDIEQQEESIEGELGGFLPDAHQFEFRVAVSNETTAIIRGKVDRALTTDELRDFNRQLVDVPATAIFLVKRLRRSGQVVRESFTLHQIQPRAQSSS